MVGLDSMSMYRQTPEYQIAWDEGYKYAIREMKEFILILERGRQTTTATIPTPSDNGARV